MIHVIVSIRTSQHILATAKVNIRHTTTRTTTARTSQPATSRPQPSPRRYPISTQITLLYRPITAQNHTQVSSTVKMMKLINILSVVFELDIGCTY